ncbi:MAG: calcium/sodium antiporter [Candidatus Nanopelagicales bacterium]
MLLTVAALVGGVVVLARAADLFVDGASALSTRFGVSPVVVGAIVIGFGTSAPELLVSGIAAAEGAADVGIGNIVGSNVANMTLVLGIAGLVGAGIAVTSSTIRREMPLAIGATVLFGWFLQGGLTRLEGVVLLVALAGALTLVVLGGRRDSADPVLAQAADAAPKELSGTARRDGVVTAVGLLGVVLGAQSLVWGAEQAATALGLSGGFVGMTLVAVGTSMPEIVTSAKAAARGSADLLIGNLLGSNMFNALAVGGVVALLAPGPVDDTKLTVVGVGAMVVSSLLALAFMLTRRTVNRIEAALLVVFYVMLLPFLL